MLDAEQPDGSSDKHDGDLPSPAAEEYNVFRDSALRYMGYANEIGESFRYQAPRLVVPSYALAFGYCASDAIFAGYRKWNDHSDTSTASKKGVEVAAVNKSEVSMQTKVAVATIDTLVWQTFASVLIPGGTINLIVRATRFGLMRSTIPANLKKWVPTIGGLASIPLIIHPIDDFVDAVMDSTVRSWWSDYSS
jgi:fission process protein 1